VFIFLIIVLFDHTTVEPVVIFPEDIDCSPNAHNACGLHLWTSRVRVRVRVRVMDSPVDEQVDEQVDVVEEQVLHH
jgi:hypothetical protein